MMGRKFELNQNFFYPESNHIEIVGILTGLEAEDILKFAPPGRIWYTRDYIKLFNDLGFTTNPRFVSFDPDTYYPCIMRFYQVPPINSYWYAYVYYDGWIYYGGSLRCRFDDWVDELKGKVRVTSMLQVWV